MDEKRIVSDACNSHGGEIETHEAIKKQAEWRKMITKNELLRTVKLLGQLAAEITDPSALVRHHAHGEYEKLQAALEKDIDEMPDDDVVISVNDFDMRDGKMLVLSESGVTQHHSGLMAVAEGLRNEKSSLVVEAIDTMIKE